MGIPQDSVISPILCNLYTNDSMNEVEGNYTECADDATLWSSNSSLVKACEMINRDMKSMCASLVQEMEHVHCIHAISHTVR